MLLFNQSNSFMGSLCTVYPSTGMHASKLEVRFIQISYLKIFPFVPKKDVLSFFDELQANFSKSIKPIYRQITIRIGCLIPMRLDACITVQGLTIVMI
ncbi:hypothetical protein BpHYR1_027421 [Brachionus plicatilis]|uniref:Uncharacterized protein n=1 Tax=Brachionus plicatilis TaxID=10195 RepID=A0A3M7SRY8_BRAPC|nr:hypothetical protein BpHYR1_027421 [Brachionus plicatilis]